MSRRMRSVRTACRGTCRRPPIGRCCTTRGVNGWARTVCWRDMFTGLIESVGRIAEIEEIESGKRLRVATELAAQLHLGDSLATNGVCLTVTDVRPPAAAVAMGGPS